MARLRCRLNRVRWVDHAQELVARGLMPSFWGSMHDFSNLEIVAPKDFGQGLRNIAGIIFVGFRAD
jgi:hypothetical protein